MKAGLERRVRQLEDYAVRRRTPDEPLSDMELARRVALILYVADRDGPPYPEIARQIALVLHKPEHDPRSTPCHER